NGRERVREGQELIQRHGLQLACGDDAERPAHGRARIYCVAVEQVQRADQAPGELNRGRATQRSEARDRHGLVLEYLEGADPTRHVGRTTALSASQVDV